MKYRNLAGFGKRIEFWIFGEMLKQGLDVYLPMVDDDGIDAVVKTPQGKFAEVQIKARSKNISPKTAALFSAIAHKPKNNYCLCSTPSIWTRNDSEFLGIQNGSDSE